MDAAETLGVLLEIMGHRVERVHDGEAAIAAVQRFDPQQVLLDIGMPKLNGYDACRRIRAQESGASRTLVAITGWGQPQDLERSRDAGFDGHRVKPIDIEALTRVIASRVAAEG